MALFNPNSQHIALSYTAEEANQKGFYFRINGQNCKIMSYRGSEQQLVIPSYINGKPVIQIGTRAFASKKLKSIVLPDTLHVIRTEAFARNEFTSITLPPNICRVEENAFSYCKKLRQVITKKTSQIDITAHAFESTPYLSEKSFVILGDMLLRVNLHTFTKLSFLEIPDGVREIKADACKFANYNIKEIGIPASVKSIGDHAFSLCYALQDVLFEKGQKYHYIKLGQSVFGSFGGQIYQSPFLWNWRRRYVEGDSHRMNGWLSFRQIRCTYKSGYIIHGGNDIYVPSSKQNEFWEILNMSLSNYEFTPYLNWNSYRNLWHQVDSLYDKLEMAVCIYQNAPISDRTDVLDFINQHIYKAIKYALEDNHKERIMMYQAMKLLSSDHGFNPKKIRSLTEKYHNDAAEYLKQIII